MASHRKKDRRKAEAPFLASYPVISAAPLWLRGLLPALVAIAAFVAFLPALDAGFVNWDDDKNIINNPNYRGLTGDKLQWMFTTTKMGHWQPLSWITLALDHAFYGEGRPGGYHLTNLLLHAAGAAAFYFLALRLLALALPPPPGEFGVKLRLAAALAALFFAVHPLRVEAVAWVTERRDVLSGLFFIATINAYLISRTALRFRRLWYVVSVLLLLVSVLSKAWGMTMPAVLLVLDFYPLRRFGAKGSGPVGGRDSGKREGRRQEMPEGLTPLMVLAEKLPFAIIAAFIAYKAKAAQAGQLDTLKTLEEHGVAARIAQAFYGLAFYVYKTSVPVNLIPIYQLPDNMNPLEARFVISAIAVVVALVLLWRYRRRWPAGLALAGCYVAIFRPISGIAQSGPQLVKDSYTYLCCLSWAVWVGSLLILAGRRWGRSVFAAAAFGGGAIILVLAALTWRQTTHWRDSKSLWEHTLAVDDDCWNAHNNLAILLKQEGRLKEAAEHYDRSLAIHPRNADALFNRGNCFKALGDFDAAIRSYLAAIDIGPDHAPGVEAARLNLGNTYRSQNKLDRSIPHHGRVAARRNDPELYRILATDSAAVGRGLASELYSVLGRNPQDAEAHFRLGKLLLDLGECAAGKAHFQQALRIRPQDAAARLALAEARARCP